MRIVGIPLALALFVPLTACYHYGELGRIGFELDIADVLYEFESGDRVLVGTRLCPELGAAIIGDEHHWLEDEDLVCFDESLTGPAQFDAERCWSLDMPGEVTWELTPNDTCLPSHPDLLGDRIRLAVVEPSGQPRLGFDDWRVRVPDETDVFIDGTPREVIGLAPGRTLAELREDPGAARHVIAGQIDAPMLRLDDDLGRIYFVDPDDPADPMFELVGAGATAIEPAPPPQPEPEMDVDEYRLAGERPLLLEPGAVARVRATLPGNLVLESPELIAAAPSDAASLDLMVHVAESGTPLHAYADVRDAQGRVLHAAPIEWSVTEGALGVWIGDLDNEVRTGEYAALGGQCESPSQSVPIERHAILRARLGTLEDTVELTWIEEAQQPGSFDEPFVPDDICLYADDLGGKDDDGAGEGCACSADTELGTGSTGMAWLGLAALLFVRRRRGG